jgi:hypothetical protein
MESASSDSSGPESLRGEAGALAGRAGGRSVADYVIDVILQLGSPHLEFFDFLVGGEVDFFFDTIDFVIEPVVFIEDVPEVVIGALKATDDLTMFRKLSQDRMM